MHAQEERLRVLAEEQAARLDALDHEIAHERRTAAAAAARERSLRDELEAQHAREAVADAEAEDQLRRARESGRAWEEEQRRTARALSLTYLYTIPASWRKGT